MRGRGTTLLLTGIAAAIAGGLGACRSEPPMNVLIVTFDTTRADHIGCYGHPASSTPHIDALAADGVRFENAFASVPITLPSHTTIMTGTDPLMHGIRDNGLFVVQDHHTTLAESLKARGYRTGAAVASFPLGRDFNLDQGFEFYDDRFAARYEDFRGRRVLPKGGIFFDERKAGQVNEAALPWLEAHHSEPFFLWLHYFDPHQPFDPPNPYNQLFIDDPYLGEIAYADESFGRVMETLRRLGVDDRTMVILTADHGEGRGDHNEETHSLLAYGSTLHVPLVVRVPGKRGGQVVKTRVGLVDIAPTVMDVLGFDLDPAIQGRSLSPELDGANRPPVRQYAETLSPRLTLGLGELRVLFDGNDKYIHGPRPELFDLEADPGELNNLINEQPERAARLEADLAAFLEERSAPRAQQISSVDSETRERLEALGYLQGGTDIETTIEEVLRSDGPAPQDRVGDVNLMSRAKQLLFEENGIAARDAANELIRRNPEDPMAFEMLASANLLIGDIDGALESVDRVMELRPGGTQRSPQFLLQLGALHYYRKDYEKARNLLASGLDLRPSAEGQYLMALTHLGEGDSDAERHALEAALELDPTYGPARVALGVNAARRGDAAAAETAFRQAIVDQPYFPRAHFNLGAFEVEHGRLEASLFHFERAVDLAPGYVQALEALALVCTELERYDAARSWYGLVRERAPESEAARRLGAILDQGSGE